MQPRRGISRTIRATLVLALVIGFSGTRAHAGFLFFSDPTAFNSQLAGQGIADEPLIFNLPGLISTGTSVQGLTATSRQVVNVEAGAQEVTTPSTGEPRVVAVAGDIHTVGFDAFDFSAPPGDRIRYYLSVGF